MADFVNFWKKDVGGFIKDDVWAPTKGFLGDIGLVDALKNSLGGVSSFIAGIGKLPNMFADNGSMLIIVVGIVGVAILASYVMPTKK